MLDYRGLSRSTITSGLKWRYKDVNVWTNVHVIIQQFSHNELVISTEKIKTGCKDRYEFICDVNSYAKEHLLMPDDEINVGERPILSTSSKEACISLGQKINFIDHWLQLFEENYDN